MAKIPSTAARFHLARQSAKGTAAASGFLCGMMQLSGLMPAFDDIDKGAEHGCSGVANERATVHKSTTRRSSYLVNGNFRGALYPDLIGLLLLGAGFKVSTVDNTDHFVHTFTLANRDEHHWLTALSKIGSKMRRASDVRVPQLELNAGSGGIVYSGQVQALTEDEALGSETGDNETLVDILPSRGTIAVDYDPEGAPVSIVGTCESTQLTVANTLDTNQQKLFSFGRSDLPQNGLDITGQIGGIDVDYANYERLVAGGAGNDTPSEETAIAAVTYRYESATDIPGALVPYSLEVAIAHAEVTLNDFEAEGNNLVEWTFAYRMVDDVASPITVTLVNEVAQY